MKYPSIKPGLCRLAQFVVQIVTNLKWEDEFKTEGIDSVVDFQAVIEEVNHIDPTFHAFRCRCFNTRRGNGCRDEHPQRCCCRVRCAAWTL